VIPLQLAAIDKIRISVSQSLPLKRKQQLSQYFTSANIAAFMASLFNFKSEKKIRLLDAGAGIGVLSAAFLDRCISEKLNFNTIELDAFEIDNNLHQHLYNTLIGYRNYVDLTIRIIGSDFIYTAVNWLRGNLFQENKFRKYTYAILNPPYKKIKNNSQYRLKLRYIGIETVNLYSAFTAVALSLLEKKGQLVAIIPRSFCNGPYYRQFRQYILRRSAIRRIHLFHSRNKAFKDDDVLQENIIILLERNGSQDDVLVSTSTDDTFDDLNMFKVPFDRIVSPDDPESFIHIPISNDEDIRDKFVQFRYLLDNIGLTVSTGPVVDFRVKKHLCMVPKTDTVPLIYPCHFYNGHVKWPIFDNKKPNAIRVNQDTKKWLYPNGYYCAVRRFSSKEEKRRVVASVVDPHYFNGASMLGFENHLNIIHCNKKGLPCELAYGLAAYLNSEFVDKLFRNFSGHTQVNATDLRSIGFPAKDILIKLGKWAIVNKKVMSTEIDRQLMRLIK
jgi:adenine-specific DNA-methyltransferase